MAQPTTNGTTKKRRKDDIKSFERDDLPALGNLDIDSDDQGASSGDDGEMDEFPELDTDDSDESTEAEQDEDTKGTENELKATQKPGELVVSSITGRLKRVYPEIEPEYDSDSSTEDAMCLLTGMMTYHISGMISMAKECYDQLKAMSWTNFSRQKKTLKAGENPDAGYDPYEPTVEWFTGKGKEEIMPLSAAPEPKRRFVPSKWEKQK
ncbi:13526_t:CDS:2, partial [Acaulospora colombiana]